MEPSSLPWNAISSTGIAGLLVAVGYLLMNRWVGAILNAMKEHTAAMTSLASSAKEQQSDQREILIAMRVLVDKIDNQKEYLLNLERNLRDKGLFSA